MTLYEEWDKKAYNPETQQEYDAFWGTYLEEEKNIYEEILKNKENKISTSIKEFASKFSLPEFKVVGFLDGINASLKEEIDLNTLDADSNISLEIDFEKLYFYMLEAKAPWLYEIPAWADILSDDERKRITKEYRDSKIVRVNKVGRNEPCICGSGKKYKKCCGK